MIKLASPLEHFELNIYTYFYNFFYDLSINSGTIYIVSLVLFLFFFHFCIFFPTLLPVKSQKIFTIFYELLLSIFKQQISSSRALKYYPFIVTLFIYIFLMNFTSLYVFGVSLTGHIMITFYLSFSIFISLVVIGLLNYGFGFFNFFVPRGVPKILLDFIIVIEIFSFAIRPFSLAIRLFANMLAGHTLMGIFSQFASFVTHNYILFFLLPLIIVFLVFVLEVAVSAIQAYIFVSLVCIYINDVIVLH